MLLFPGMDSIHKQYASLLQPIWNSISRSCSCHLFRHWKTFDLAVFLYSHPDTHFPFFVFPNSSLSTSSELHTPSQWLSAIHLSDPLPISSSKSPCTISSPSQSCHLPLLRKHRNSSCSFNLLQFCPYITTNDLCTAVCLLSLLVLLHLRAAFGLCVQTSIQRCPIFRADLFLLPVFSTTTEPKSSPTQMTPTSICPASQQQQILIRHWEKKWL